MCCTVDMADIILHRSCRSCSSKLDAFVDVDQSPDRFVGNVASLCRSFVFDLRPRILRSEVLMSRAVRFGVMKAGCNHPRYGSFQRLMYMSVAWYKSKSITIINLQEHHQHGGFYTGKHGRLTQNRAALRSPNSMAELAFRERDWRIQVQYNSKDFKAVQLQKTAPRFGPGQAQSGQQVLGFCASRFGLASSCA